MANKSFSIYSSREDVVTDIHDQLLLEIGKTHIACIDTNDHKKTISAFELFNFTEKEAADFPKLFAAISADSKLLSNSFPATHIFINSELSILIPVLKFNTDIAVDYLNLIFG